MECETTKNFQSLSPQWMRPELRVGPKRRLFSPVKGSIQRYCHVPEPRTRETRCSSKNVNVSGFSEDSALQVHYNRRLSRRYSIHLCLRACETCTCMTDLLVSMVVPQISSSFYNIAWTPGKELYHSSRTSINLSWYRKIQQNTECFDDYQTQQSPHN